MDLLVELVHLGGATASLLSPASSWRLASASVAKLAANHIGLCQQRKSQMFSSLISCGRCRQVAWAVRLSSLL